MISPSVCWHQYLRKDFSDPANFIVDDILVVKRGIYLARYLKIFLTFFFSGLHHLLVEIGAGLTERGAMRFFCMQALGICLEDTVQAVYHWAFSIKKAESPKLWARLIGYLWLLVFLVWTTPGWNYPNKGRVG